MRVLVLPAVVGLGLALAAPAAAHQRSMTHARLTETADRRGVDYELRVRAADLAEVIGVAAEPTAAVLRERSEALWAYVGERVVLGAPGQPGCRVDRAPLEIVEDAGRVVVLRLALRCPAPIVEAELDYTLFDDLDPEHVGLVALDGELARLRAPDDARLSWTIGAPPIEGLGGFVLSGIEHIRTGLDHILFVLALLVVVVLRRAPGGGVERRPTAAAVRATAGIVTSFTLAHSLTLIAAALGWVALPSRLVESAIAASIVVVAFENVVRPDPRGRAIVAFGFGLVHGLGFAAMLAPLLPPDGVVLPLLAFNVGVELGQLALVALALPVLVAAARGLGAERYRARVVPLAAGVLGVLGAVWLVERAFEVSILGL